MTLDFWLLRILWLVFNFRTYEFDASADDNDV